MDTVEKLDRITELQAQADTLRQDYIDRRAAILGKEILAQLAEIEAEEALKLSHLSDAVNLLTGLVKDEVIATGASVKGASLMAMYVKARTTWDSPALYKHAEAHPEMNRFLKEGEPTVSFRTIK